MKTPSLSIRLVALVVAIGLSSAQAQNQFYGAALSGAAESPPNASPGTGTAFVIVNPITHLLFVTVTFAGLIGMTSASHIHAATAVPFAGTAGVATQTPTFMNFPLGVTSGSYSMSFDMSQTSTWNASYISANGGSAATAEAAFIAAVQGGQSYLNIHTNAFPGGEIRGFLVPTVPETGSAFALMLLALGGLVVVRRQLSRA